MRTIIIHKKVPWGSILGIIDGITIDSKEKHPVGTKWRISWSKFIRMLGTLKVRFVIGGNSVSYHLTVLETDWKTSFCVNDAIFLMKNFLSVKYVELWPRIKKNSFSIYLAQHVDVFSWFLSSSSKSSYLRQMYILPLFEFNILRET